MKPKSKSTEPLISSSNLGTTQFGQVSPGAWRVSGETMTIDEYIEYQRQDVNSTDLRVLGSFTAHLLDKLKETNANEYPGLGEAIRVIARVLESPAAQEATDPLPTWLAEAGFAAGYFLKRYDLIPDHLPEIGLADDALILQRVIERNQSELHRSLAECICLASGETMNPKFTDFKESMTTELTNFIQSQARALSLADLDRLIVDLPALRARFAKIPSQTYAYLSDKLEFLGLFIEEQIVGRNRDLAEEPVAEAAFALLYFQRATDLIPDSIHGIGLLDDAMIVSMVLRRQEQAFKGSSHAYMLRWPEPRFDVDQLLSVISPLRVTSFCSSLAIRPPG